MIGDNPLALIYEAQARAPQAPAVEPDPIVTGLIERLRQWLASRNGFQMAPAQAQRPPNSVDQATTARLNAPFVQDTLIPLLGVDPRFRAAPLETRADLLRALNTTAYVTPYEPNAINIARSDAGDGLIAHEMQHVSDYLQRGDPRIFLNSGLEGVPATPAINPFNGARIGFEQDLDLMEARAYAFQDAIQLLRKGAVDAKALAEADKKRPGVRAIYNNLRSIFEEREK